MKLICFELQIGRISHCEGATLSRFIFPHFYPTANKRGVQSRWLCRTDIAVPSPPTTATSTRTADKLIISAAQHQALFDKRGANYQDNDLKDHIWLSIISQLGWLGG